MIGRIIVIYLIGFAVTVLIRILDMKLDMIKIKSRESKEEILIFSLLWFISWALLFVFLGLEELKTRKVKKDLKAED